MSGATHKYPKIVQVGDKVKYKSGEAHYLVIKINKCGERCVLKHNTHGKFYNNAWIKSLDVVQKNVHILSHKEIKERTLSKEYYEKTNPHKKVGMSKPKKKIEKDYLVTVYEPMASLNDKADVNDKVYSRKVVTGEKALSEHILELDSLPVKHQREVRVLGREVKIDIKREVVIK